MSAETTHPETVPYAFAVVGFEGIEDLVHPPRTWTLNDINGRKLVVTTLEDDITGDLVISDVWDFDTVRTVTSCSTTRRFGEARCQQSRTRSRE
jgi:hypothetical protein